MSTWMYAKNWYRKHGSKLKKALKNSTFLRVIIIKH